MKIDFNLSENFIKCYDEARGIAFHKRKILKTKKINYLSYMKEVFIVFIILLLFGLITIFNIENIYFTLYAYSIIFIDIVYLILNISGYFNAYKYRKNKDFINSLIIDENGITDITSFSDIEILFKWNRIKGIVVKKHSVVILTDTPVYFFADIKDKDKLIEIIKKYNKNILIIK